MPTPIPPVGGRPGPSPRPSTSPKSGFKKPGRSTFYVFAPDLDNETPDQLKDRVFAMSTAGQDLIDEYEGSWHSGSVARVAIVLLILGVLIGGGLTYAFKPSKPPETVTVVKTVTKDVPFRDETAIQDAVQKALGGQTVKHEADLAALSDADKQTIDGLRQQIQTLTAAASQPKPVQSARIDPPDWFTGKKAPDVFAPVVTQSDQLTQTPTVVPIAPKVSEPIIRIEPPVQAQVSDVNDLDVPGFTRLSQK